MSLPARNGCRFLARLVLRAVVVGMLLSIAVAWSCAVVTDPEGGAGVTATAGPDGVGPVWTVWAWSRPGAHRVLSHRYIGSQRSKGKPLDLVPNWAGFDVPNRDDSVPAMPFEIRMADARGWPWVALWSECDNAYSLTPVIHGGVPLPFHRGHGTGVGPVLPLRPIWPGLLKNTVFYAISVLCVTSPWTIRRALRLFHHRCRACGYPIGVSEVCTECGRSLMSQIKN